MGGKSHGIYIFILKKTKNSTELRIEPHKIVSPPPPMIYKYPTKKNKKKKKIYIYR